MHERRIIWFTMGEAELIGRALVLRSYLINTGRVSWGAQPPAGMIDAIMRLRARGRSAVPLSAHPRFLIPS